MNKTTAVLYFGGSTISIVLAEPGVNGSLVIKSSASEEYSGIFSGEFINPQELVGILTHLINNAFKNVKVKIDKLYIGAPAGFCDCIVHESYLNFEKPHKISQSDLKKLHNAVSFNTEGGTVINKSAVYYRTDEGRPVINVKGISCQTVSAHVSMIVCSNYFISIVRNCLFGSKFKRIEFISAALAEALYLIDQEVRDSSCVLISCGLSSTSVSVVAGDGLLYLQSFNTGKAHLINDVSIVMNVPFEVANMLVNEAIISVSMGEQDNYEILHAGKKRKFEARVINDIIKSRLEVMAEQIESIISDADPNLLAGNSVFICGGSTDAIAGVRDFFAKALGTYITQCVCPFTKQNKSNELTVNALLNLAIMQEK